MKNIIKITLTLTFLISSRLALASEVAELVDSGNNMGAFISIIGTHNVFDPSYSQGQGVFLIRSSKTSAFSFGSEKYNTQKQDSGFVRWDQNIFSFMTFSAEYHQDNWYAITSARKANILAFRFQSSEMTNSSLSKKGSSGNSGFEFDLGYYQSAVCQSWNDSPYTPFRFNSGAKESFYILNFIKHYSFYGLKSKFELGNWNDFFLGSSDLWRLELNWKLLQAPHLQLDLGSGMDWTGLGGLTTQFINYHASIGLMFF